MCCSGCTMFLAGTYCLFCVTLADVMNAHQQTFIWSYYYHLVKDVTNNIKDEHGWKSELSDTDWKGSGLLIWNSGHHEVKYFPLFNHTQYPWLLCIFSFKCFLSLVLDCSTNNQGIRKVLKVPGSFVGKLAMLTQALAYFLLSDLKGWQWKTSSKAMPVLYGFL